MENFKHLLGELQDYNFQGEYKRARYYKLISHLLKNIHSQIPRVKYDTGKVAAPTNIREENFEGVNYQRAVMFLLSNGCEWALKDGNGCTMCGHLAKQARRGEMIPSDDYVHQFSQEFEKIDFKKYPLLNLYNNGSFLNDNELSPYARVEILKRINGNKDIKMLVLETRPEFVTEEKIKEIKELIPDKHIEIALGLEIKNDIYRTICVNKGFSSQQFEEASRLIIRHLHLRTYILLKPLFLSELESIKQAVETIEYAFGLGASTVSLEACTVQDFTLVNYLYEHGFYSTPWLWSIIEVLKRAKTPGKLIVGMFQFYPSPLKTPYNCEQCSQRILEAICQYNRTLDLTFFDGLSCECRNKWEKVLEENSPPFKERLEMIFNKLR